MRLRDCADYLQFEQQAIPVCEHRHGQGSPQVHRVQRTPRVPHQQEYYRGESIYPLRILRMNEDAPGRVQGLNH